MLFPLVPVKFLDRRICPVFHHANWHSSATLTEGFRAFSSVVRQIPGFDPQRRGTATAFPKINCVVMCTVCDCAHYRCHRVSTQLHLTNISICMYKLLSHCVQANQKNTPLLTAVINVIKMKPAFPSNALAKLGKLHGNYLRILTRRHVCINMKCVQTC